MNSTARAVVIVGAITLAVSALLLSCATRPVRSSPPIDATKESPALPSPPGETPPNSPPIAAQKEATPPASAASPSPAVAGPSEAASPSTTASAPSNPAGSAQIEAAVPPPVEDSAARPSDAIASEKQAIPPPERPLPAPAAFPPPKPALAESAGSSTSEGAAPIEIVPREKLLPAKERIGYLDAALADFRRLILPNGVRLAIKRQAGKNMAAASILLARDPKAKVQEEGYEALALSAMARATGAGVSGIELAAQSPGGSFVLKLEDEDHVEIELLCPAEALISLLGLFARELAGPSFTQAGFDRALREARVAERRESGDPLHRAVAELRSGLYGGSPYGLPPRGTAASLASATKDKVLRYWSDRFEAGRLSVAVVCDSEPVLLAEALTSIFGALHRKVEQGVAQDTIPSAEKIPPPPIRPWFKALPISATPESSVIRGVFGAPDPLSPDSAAMTVGLAMLEDLLRERLRGDKGHANGAWARFSNSIPPSTDITVYKTGNPMAAKAAVDAAIADLASGLCLGAGGRDAALGQIALSLESYESRAITASYSSGASPEGMASRMARDLAAGGDGASIFRLEGRLRSVTAADVARVARQWLLDGPSAWVALGDPEIVLALPPSTFASVPRLKLAAVGPRPR